MEFINQPTNTKIIADTKADRIETSETYILCFTIKAYMLYKNWINKPTKNHKTYELVIIFLQFGFK